MKSPRRIQMIIAKIMDNQAWEKVLNAFKKLYKQKFTAEEDQQNFNCSIAAIAEMGKGLFAADKDMNLETIETIVNEFLFQLATSSNSTK